MPTSQLYFQSSAGTWDNLTVGQGPASLYGTAGTSLKATVKIPTGVTGLSLGLNISIKPNAVGGPLAVAVSSIKLIEPSGTVDNVYTVYYGGCTFPVILAAPGSYDNTGKPVNFNDMASSWAGKTLTLEVNACQYAPFGSSGIEWGLTAYFTAVIPLQNATATFTVLGGGVGLSNLPIQANDLTSGMQTTIYTNSQGIATLTGIDVGDDISLTITMANANAIKETVSIESATDNFNITMTCVTGYSFQNGTCELLGGIGGGISSALSGAGKYILIAAAGIGGVAIAYELTKGHAEHEEILAEREIPKLP